MEKHRAVIVGCGRIGVEGFGTPFVYSHKGAYEALSDRVELVATVDKEPGKGDYTDLEKALAKHHPDIVSICTPPEGRARIFRTLGKRHHVKGIWCEKPLCLLGEEEEGEILHEVAPWQKVQVNYIRRFDSVHRRVGRMIYRKELGDVVRLVIMAKGDEASTRCHFVDLARWWGIPDYNMTYAPLDGTNYTETTYHLFLEDGLVAFSEGGMCAHAYRSTAKGLWFPGIQFMRGGAEDLRGSTPPDFMQTALGNLLDSVDEDEEPACNLNEAITTNLSTWRTL